MSNVSMCHTRTPKPPSNYPTAPQGSPTNWWGSLFSHESRSHTLIGAMPACPAGLTLCADAGRVHALQPTHRVRAGCLQPARSAEISDT